MHKKQLMHYKPAYENGQLLLADDFIREQQHHADALRRHSLELHGVGVVRGLEVARASDSAVSVSPGVAIDGRGRQVVLHTAEVLELQGASASGQMAVTLGYRTEREGPDGGHGREIGCHALVRVAAGIEEGDLVLATLRLDERGRLAADGVSGYGRRELPRVAPASVLLDSLHPSLRTGWLRMPFRPTVIPQDQKDAQPPFRIGPTMSVAHKEIDGKPNTRGAGGTMAVMLPPHATHIHKFRVAGNANEKKIRVELFKGGWDGKSMQHVAVKLVEREFSDSPYDQVFDIPQELGGIDPEGSTLSMELRSAGYAEVSLVAMQVSY